jgi:hypothetical protein
MDNFNLKKFITEGRLLKENYGSRHHHPGHELIHKYLDDSGVDPTNAGWEEKLRIDDIRGYEGYSEDQSALFKLIKDVDRAGGETELFLEPYDVKLETYGDDDTLRIEIIDGSDTLQESEEYADNIIEFNGEDIDLDTMRWKVYDKDRSDFDLESVENTHGEEINFETLDAFTEMYFDKFSQWVWDYGDIRYA